MLVEITERAMAHCGSQEVLIVGGVGCERSHTDGVGDACLFWGWSQMLSITVMLRSKLPPR